MQQQLIMQHEHIYIHTCIPDTGTYHRSTTGGDLQAS